MLSVLNTEQLKNVRISGDYWDLKELYQATQHLLHTASINCYQNHVQRNYLLRFSRDVESAMEGNEVIETTFNGVYDELQEEFSVSFPQENIYFSFEKSWPKMMFTVLSFNYFIENTTEINDSSFQQGHIMTIRKFQSLLFECFSSLTYTPTTFATLFFQTPKDFHQFLAQYVDLMNAKYLSLPLENKKQFLSNLLLKFHEPDFEYTCFKNVIKRTAKETNLPIHRIVLQAD